MFRVPFRRVLRLCLTCARSATRAAHAFEILPAYRHACSMRFHVIAFQLSARVPVACTMWQQRRFQFRARATIESFDVTLAQGTETDASIVSARGDHSSAQFVLIILLLQPLWNVFKPTYCNLFEPMLKLFDIWTYRDSSFRKSSQMPHSLHSAGAHTSRSCYHEAAVRIVNARHSQPFTVDFYLRLHIKYEKCSVRRWSNHIDFGFSSRLYIVFWHTRMTSRSIEYDLVRRLCRILFMYSCHCDSL